MPITQTSSQKATSILSPSNQTLLTHFQEPNTSQSQALKKQKIDESNNTVDSFLKPLMFKISSYIKDTNHFLEKSEELGSTLPHSFLATIDVCALNTHIPHREGILAAKEAVERRQTEEPKTWVILCLLHRILSKTY